LKSVDHEPSIQNEGMEEHIYFLTILTKLVAGCSSGFYRHDSVFKDWDQVKFSWWGYKNPTAEDAKKSAQEGW